MKRWMVCVILWGFALCPAFGAPADLDGLIAELNLQARADLDVFNTRLSAQFDLPLPEVEILLEKVASPADAFLCLQIGFLTREPLDVVVKAYKAKKGKGWGVIAQSLGLKPGSAEFHALKSGKFTLTGKPAPAHGHTKAKGKKKD